MANRLDNRNKIIMRDLDDNELLTFPFSPDSYYSSNPQKNIIVDLYKYGLTPVDTKPDLTKVSFSSFFSDDEALNNIRLDSKNTALQCLQIIDNYKKSRKMCKLTITGTIIGTSNDFFAIVDSFEYKTSPSKDFYYDITFIEGRDFKSKRGR